MSPVAKPRVQPRHVWQGVITEYRDRLPVSGDTPVVTLREGGTPLLAAPVLSARTGCEVYLKVEGGNPTGSFKDRGMTVAISVAAGAGAKAVICASTGNTSACAAAYAARAGLSCVVLVPRGKIAIGKLAQALVHGARLLQVDGSFDDCLELARKLAAQYPVALVNSVNPDRLQARRPPPSRSSTTSATRPTCTACRSATPATSPPTGWATPSTARRPRGPRAADVRVPGQRGGADRDRPARAAAADHRDRDPDRQPGLLAAGRGGARRVRRPDRLGHRPGDPGRLPADRHPGGGVRRTGLLGQRGGPAQGQRERPDPGGLARGLHHHRERPEGPGLALSGAPSPATISADPGAAAVALGLA